MIDKFSTVQLGKVASVRSGFAFKSEDMGEYGAPIIKIKHIVPPTVEIEDVQRIPHEIVGNDPRIQQFALQKDDILIAMTGATVGKVGRMPKIDETYYLNQRVGKVFLTAPDKADYDFIYYVLSQDISVGQMFSVADGSAQANISGNQIELMEIPLPPLPEQRAIAHILDALDDKIELNRRMNQTLEAMAQALFKSWFVDFEPFRNQGMQDSPLGEIPVGWRCASVADAIEVNPPRRLDRGADAIHVGMSALPTASTRVLDTAKRPYSGSGSRFANGDILLARITPCLENGKTAMVDFLPDNEIGWGSTEFIVLGPKPPVGTSFIYCFARHQDFRVHAIQAMTGTSGRQRVDTACFSHCWIAIPEADILRQFEQQVKSWFQKMKANDEESHTLASIRDTLLPKLLSGEIRVKDAEKFVEEKI